MREPGIWGRAPRGMLLLLMSKVFWATVEKDNVHSKRIVCGKEVGHVASSCTGLARGGMTGWG